MHIHTVHEHHKDHKCKSCWKSFSQAGSLKKHIHTVHEHHKDYKCKSCCKSFSQAGSLKTHIKNLHEVKNLYTNSIHENAKPEIITKDFNFTPEKDEELLESSLKKKKDAKILGNCQEVVIDQTWALSETSQTEIFGQSLSETTEPNRTEL